MGKVGISTSSAVTVNTSHQTFSVVVAKYFELQMQVTGSIEVTVLKPPTGSVVMTALAGSPYHVFDYFSLRCDDCKVMYIQVDI